MARSFLVGRTLRLAEKPYLARAKSGLGGQSETAKTSGYTIAYCPAEQADLEKALMQEYGIDAVTARNDVDAFLARLREKALITE